MHYGWTRAMWLLLVASLLATACSSSGGDEPDDPGAGPTNSSVPGTSPRAGLAGGPFAVRLSAGEPIAGVAATTQIVDGEPLEADALQAVYDRLPEWIVDDDQPEFNRPADSLRPPLVGQIVPTPFPVVPGTGSGTGSTDPTVPGTGPLQVLRYQPEGEVTVAPYLSVTFDQPMVPLGTLDQLDAAEVPAVVTPAIEGRWRWIGTRTLRFEIEPGQVDRLPAATEFTVEIPAGTVSQTGGALDEAVTWTFATTPPEVSTVTPMHDSLPLEPVFFIGFDQVVDPDAVLTTMALTADGEGRALRLASEDEIEADDRVRPAVEAALDGRWLAVRPVEPLPVDTAVALTVGPGTPSAEGPRTTTSADVHRGRTYPPLAVDDHGCSYGDDCVPGTPLFVDFTNPLDPATFDPELVTVDPAIAGLTVNHFGDRIELIGATTGRTAYTVTLHAALADVHGQTLGRDQTVVIETGEARPYLVPFERPFVTVDPLADRAAVDLVTTNHDSVRVRAWRVEPADYAEYTEWAERFWDERPPPDPDWLELLDETVDIDGPSDAQVETPIDLSAAFDASPTGQIVVRVDPTREFSRNSDEWWMNRPTVVWAQSTTLGLDAFLDGRTAHVWTTDLTTGEPVGGVPVELLGTDETVTTDADGLASVPLGSTGGRALVATRDGSTAMLTAGWFNGWTREESIDQFRWYTFDDRGTYRPGETVRLKGWLRVLTLRQDADIERFAGAETVAFTAHDSFGNEIASGSVPVNALGGFDLDFAIPDGANLGFAWIDLRVNDSSLGSTSHQYQIQEFRRPDFEVKTRPESPAPYLMAEPLTVAAEAAYFAGGPLPDAPVEWTVTTRDSSYAPPGHPAFSFGVWQPWWLFGYDGFAADFASVDYECFEFDCGPGFPGGEADVETFSGRTDGSGTHYLRMDFDAPDVDLPRTVVAEATVTDVNRQAWTDRSDLLVHPADVYVGLRSDRSFVRQGDPLTIETIVADIDGEIVAGRPVTVTAARLEWQFVDGAWSETEVDPQTCDVVSTDAVVDCEFPTPVGGTIKVSAVATDEAGRSNRSELTRWVSGGDTVPRSRRIELESATLVPDREEYAPGDTAEILVQSPFAPATGHLTIERNGIVSTEVFEATDGSAVLEVPLTDDQVPGITVQVDLVGTAPRVGDDGEPLDGAPPRPAFATGRLDLRIPPTTRELTVTATPASSEVDPGATTSVELAVAGPNGSPVAGAEVALVVVDEAILALSGYQLPDPLDVFYAPFGSRLWTEYVRATVTLRNPFAFAAGGGDEAASSDDGGDGNGAAVPTTVALPEGAEELADADVGFRAANQATGRPIDVRENFDALAVYAPSETTGADGTVTVEVPLPDTLTRYRVMAVAVDGDDRFGSGESSLTARLPLSVRPSAPRFLNFGDAFELPVVVQNLTDTDRSVDVVLQTSNLTLTDVAGKRVTVPAGDRIEVRFPSAADEVGTARFRAAAVSGDAADAATVELPVYTPATAEAFATYGVVDTGAIAQPILAPEGVFPQFGGLEVTTSSTAVQALTDAVLYLSEYRYESADAYASRILAIAALRDVLEAFAADGLPAPAELEATIERDLDGLTRLQNGDGGFGWWRRDGSSDPYVSIHAAHAIVAAAAEGYSVPGETRGLALSYLRDIENRFPSAYPQAVRDSLSAYALHVRDLDGDRDSQKARTLYQRAGDTLALDALAWLWPVIDDAPIEEEIERRFLNAAVDTAGAATFTTGYGEDAYLVLASDRRTDGIVLDALIGKRPDSDLIPKVVAGLLGNQVRGRWNNAQENAFILLALHRYFETYEAQDPDFVARVWLGDTYAAEHAYAGRSTDRGVTLVPMSELVAGGDTDIVVAKDGAGRLYYRLGLRYAPENLTLDPRDEGFVVDRVYEAIDDPADVTRDADGTWRIAAGAEVRIRLTMVADARRTHVALIDPLPAGLEPLNPALAVSADLPPDPAERESGWCWCWSWYEHQNLRDDRVEAHTSYLSAGTYEYTYVARATTPGMFVVPPARAEEVYAPEVFGRSGSTTVVVDE